MSDETRWIPLEATLEDLYRLVPPERLGQMIGPHRDLGGHHLRGQGEEPDAAGDRTRRQEQRSGWHDLEPGCGDGR